MASLSIFISFFAGLLSFLSPCVLPLVPGFLGYLSGLVSSSQKTQKKGQERRGVLRSRIFLNSVFFVAGFSISFTIIGLLLNGLLQSAGYDIKLWLSRIGGLLVFFFGLYVLGIVRIPLLEQEHKLSPLKTRYQYLTSALFGATFAVGWSPCIGAVLGSILTLAAVDPAGAVPSLLAYSIGLGLPFMLIGALGEGAIPLLKPLKGFAPLFKYVAGFFLIILGVLIATQQISNLANLVAPSQLLPFFGGDL